MREKKKKKKKVLKQKEGATDIHCIYFNFPLLVLRCDWYILPIRLEWDTLGLPKEVLSHCEVQPIDIFYIIALILQ